MQNRAPAPLDDVQVKMQPRRRIAWLRSAWQLWSLVVMLLLATFIALIYFGPKSSPPSEWPTLPVHPAR